MEAQPERIAPSLERLRQKAKLARHRFFLCRNQRDRDSPTSKSADTDFSQAPLAALALASPNSHNAARFSSCSSQAVGLLRALKIIIVPCDKFTLR